MEASLTVQNRVLYALIARGSDVPPPGWLAGPGHQAGDLYAAASIKELVAALGGELSRTTVHYALRHLERAKRIRRLSRGIGWWHLVDPIAQQLFQGQGPPLPQPPAHESAVQSAQST